MSEPLLTTDQINTMKNFILLHTEQGRDGMCKLFDRLFDEHRLLKVRLRLESNRVTDELSRRE